MKIVLTGSVAYDYLMHFPGHFTDHILPEHLEKLSLSFLVDRMIRRRGGVATNIAYSMALLEERVAVMACVGQDFQSYGKWLEDQGVDTSAIHVEPDLFTSSFFVTTDDSSSQIASFYPGAMERASKLKFADLDYKPDLVVISPNDPAAMDEYVDECQANDFPFFYDPSQQIVRLDQDSVAKGIEGSRALFSNEYEFGLIEKLTEWTREDIVSKTEFTVITTGEQGADLHHDGKLTKISSVTPADIADPTGVGDAFRAGFLKGYTRQLSLETCAKMGVLTATYCLEHEGPQGHSFTLRQFVERFRSHFDDAGDLDGIL
jgi:adenosine kinase